MKLGFWDYVTFLSFFVVGVGFVASLVLLAGLARPDCPCT